MDKSQYKDVYVFAEQRDGAIQSVAYELVSKARVLADTLGEKVVAILAGSGIKKDAKSLIAYGADTVLAIDDANLKEYVTEQYTQAVYSVITKFNPSIVLFGATTIGRDLAPRLAARLGTGLTADCTKLEISEDTKELQGVSLKNVKFISKLGEKIVYESEVGEMLFTANGVSGPIVLSCSSFVNKYDMKEDCINSVKQYSLDNFVEKYINLIESLNV